MLSLKDTRIQTAIGLFAVALGVIGWSIVRDLYVYPKPPRAAASASPVTCGQEQTDNKPAVAESPPTSRQRASVDLTPFYWSLRQIESHDGAWLIGTDGCSYGPYGIIEETWYEGCGQLGIDWNFAEHINDPDRCEYVLYGVFLRRCPDALPSGDFEKLTYAFRGWRDVEYWARVRNLMGTYGKGM